MRNHPHFYFMLTSEILKLFNKRITKSYESGCESVFVKLNNKVGLKLYSTQKERDFAYNLQNKVEKYSLAPTAYDKVSLDDYEIKWDEDSNCQLIPRKKKKIYGYTTAVASKPNLSNRFYSKLENLIEQAKNHGLETCDIHEANVGYFNRRLVIIDFGRITME
jgi:hypothetical protein